MCAILSKNKISFEIILNRYFVGEEAKSFVIALKPCISFDFSCLIRIFVSTMPDFKGE